MRAFWAKFGNGVERIPDRPGVDGAARESRGRVGRREIDRRDLAPGDLFALERRDEQIMRARTLGDADLLAAQIRKRLDRRILGHDDRLPIAARRNYRDIVDIGVSGLRKDRRSVAGVTIIHAARIDGFQQRRAKGEFDPFDRNALRLETLLEQLLRLHDERDRGLLIADAQFANRLGAGWPGKGQRSSGEEEASAVHIDPSTISIKTIDLISLRSIFVNREIAGGPPACAPGARARPDPRGDMPHPLGPPEGDAKGRPTAISAASERVCPV